MGENCDDCMEWEEEMYWSHFKFIHFSQFLLPGFDQRLAIPQKFSAQCKKKLPETVRLKSPSGATYNVGLQAENNTLAFCLGWEEFVKDHLLEKNDLLVFKFDGSSHFDVLIFDGESLCEKAASYFVRKCGHAEGVTGQRGKRKAVDYSATSSRSDVNGAPEMHINTDVETTPMKQPLISETGKEHEHHVNLDVHATPVQAPPVISLTANERAHVDFVVDAIPLQQHVISPTGNGRVREGKYAISAFREMQRAGSNTENSDDLDIKPDIRTVSVGTKRKTSSSIFLPERRVITGTEKRNALSLARAATSPDGFLVFMKRSHVSTKYFLTIPNKWMQKFLSVESQDVVLRVDQRTWYTTFRYFRNGNFGGLSVGWRKFVQDNGLYECDICVFEPNFDSKPLLLDVYIFHASGVDQQTIADPVAID